MHYSIKTGSAKGGGGFIRQIRVAKIAVEKAAFGFDKLFSYLVPEQWTQIVQVGTRVLVPFGKGNQKRQGIVLETEEVPDIDLRLKPVFEVIDSEVLLTPEMLELIYYLKNTTFCTYYDAVKLLIPKGAGAQVNDFVSAKPGFDESALSGGEREIIIWLRRETEPVALENLCKVFRLDSGCRLIRELIEKGALEITERSRRRIQDETLLLARLCEGVDREELDSCKLTPKQRAVAELLLENGTASIKEIGYFTGVTRGVVDGLCKKGIAELFEETVIRNPYDFAGEVQNPEEIVLNEEQQEAFDGLLALYKTGKARTALLRGVTGSGKTMVFIRLIARVVADHRQAIMLVPEISLTPQVIGRFTDYFGENLAVLHSGLSMGERMDQWKQIKNGQVKIVIGTRSAVFAPCENIGLLIMDEEQENSYKSEAAPRFQTRDVAKFRASRHQSLLLLASATPTVESYYFAQTGKYHLIELNSRFNSDSLPPVYVVDMKDELRNGNATSFSSVLTKEIESNLQKNEQTILLLNRRGYHTIVTCANCGDVVTCPHCSIAMTYHKDNGQLMCHTCGYARPFVTACPKCGSEYVRYTGSGTQKAEAELKELFPGARILRMDTDTTMAKLSHQRYFTDFSEGKYDILLGTQMISKGLDFPNVTLVGVLNADQSLYANDFRSMERTFSMLTQVIGRCGRGELGGRAYVQTMTPENEIFTLAASQDYPKFYAEEIALRKLMLYPPFCDICIAGFDSVREQEAKAAAELFFQHLTVLSQKEYSDIPLRLYGPMPFTVFKASGRFRYKLVIKCKNGRRFRELLGRAMTELDHEKSIRNVRAYADMNYAGIF